MQEFPEPPGYSAYPGMVKCNPLNNEIYLERCKEAYPEWADILDEIHTYLSEQVPGYNIAQIKDKFWTLCFYWDAPEGFEGDLLALGRAVNEMVNQAPPLPRRRRAHWTRHHQGGYNDA